MLSLLSLSAEAATTINGGTISTNTTWTVAGSPYTVNGTVDVGGPASPILIIQPGVTVKFGSGVMLRFGNVGAGGLSAVGTPTSQITFTKNKNATWAGLQFNASSLASTVAFANISSATYGVRIQGGANPITVQNVSFTSNGYGLWASTTAPLTLYANSFATNTTNGVFTANPLTALFCWWNSASGPSGNAISGPVAYEPWLASAPSANHYFLPPFTRKNKTFNATIGMSTHFGFTTSSSGNWTVKIINSASAIVRTYTGSGSTSTVSWDGKNGAAVLQPIGNYTYRLESTSTGGQVAAAAMGNIILVNTPSLLINSLTVTPAFFSPNSDGVQDTALITGALNSYPDSAWTVNVKNSGGTVVRTLLSSGLSLSTSWDGKNGSAVIEPDALYTIEAIATNDAAASPPGTATVTLDNAMPEGVISSPPNGTWSNIHQNWVTSIPVVGTANDANLNNWVLDVGAGSNPGSWTTLATATTVRLNTTLATWATENYTNGLWSLRLRVTDKAGNQTINTKQITLNNVAISQNADEFNAASGGTLTYVSQIPFNVTQTLEVKDAGGQVVRTLVNGVSRSAGTYNDVWNGRNNSGNLLKDGPYFFFSTIFDGTNTYTLDLSNQFKTGSNVFYAPLINWNAWNNQPLRVNYTFFWPGRLFIELAYSPSGELEFNHNCSVNVCVVEGEYQESGTHLLTWAMVNNNGVPRPDINVVAIGKDYSSVPKNAVVLFGSKPTVNNFKALPSIYYAGSGANQTISFDLTSYQNQPVNGTITVTNHTNGAIIPILTLTNLAPGSNISIPWDGKSAAGNWLPPGGYTLILTVTDSLGNTVNIKNLTRLRY